MKKLSRRSFLQISGIGGAAATAVTLSSMNGREEEKNNPGKRLNIALCGLGRYTE